MEKLINVKQEPECHFVLVLPPSDFIEAPKQVTLKMIKIKFDCQVEVFDEFEKCQKCDEFSKNLAKHSPCGGLPTYGGKFQKQTLQEEQQLLRLSRAAKCFLCPIVLPSRTARQKHINAKHRDEFGDIKCLHINCVKRYTNITMLRRHCSNVHVDVKQLTCSICSKVFPGKLYLRRHIRRVHFPKKFKCDFCSFESSLKDRIRKHVEKHLQYRVKNFICDKCGQQLINKEGIKLHLSCKSKKCFHCEAEFNCKLLFDQHCKEAHKDCVDKWPCETCSEVFPKLRDLKYHQRMKQHGKRASNPEIFVCRECSRRFKTQKALLEHLRSYHKAFLKCHICSVAFKNADRLKLHLENHANEKTFACRMCTFVTLKKSQLPRHYRAIHSCSTNFNKNTKSQIVTQQEHQAEHFECKLCGKVYNKLKNLRIHLKVKRKCLICSLELPCTAPVTKHIDENHRNEQGRIECPHNDCLNSYKSFGRFRSHRASHRRSCDVKLLICSICSKVLSRKSCLENHMKNIHNKTWKTFTCDSCRQKFLCKESLRNHLTQKKCQAKPARLLKRTIN